MSTASGRLQPSKEQCYLPALRIDCLFLTPLLCGFVILGKVLPGLVLQFLEKGRPASADVLDFPFEQRGRFKRSNGDGAFVLRTGGSDLADDFTGTHFADPSAGLSHDLY